MAYFRFRWQGLGAHVHVRVFVSTHYEGTYANAGHLTMTRDEWAEFRDAQARAGFQIVHETESKVEEA